MHPAKYTAATGRGPEMTGERYEYKALVDYAGALLAAAGLDREMAG